MLQDMDLPRSLLLAYFLGSFWTKLWMEKPLLMLVWADRHLGPGHPEYD